MRSESPRRVWCMLSFHPVPKCCLSAQTQDNPDCSTHFPGNHLKSSRQTDVELEGCPPGVKLDMSATQLPLCWCCSRSPQQSTVVKGWTRMTDLRSQVHSHWKLRPHPRKLPPSPALPLLHTDVLIRSQLQRIHYPCVSNALDVFCSTPVVFSSSAVWNPLTFSVPGWNLQGILHVPWQNVVGAVRTVYLHFLAANSNVLMMIRASEWYDLGVQGDELQFAVLWGYNLPSFHQKLGMIAQQDHA